MPGDATLIALKALSLSLSLSLQGRPCRSTSRSPGDVDESVWVLAAWATDSCPLLSCAEVVQSLKSLRRPFGWHLKPSAVFKGN